MNKKIPPEYYQSEYWVKNDKEVLVSFKANILSKASLLFAFILLLLNISSLFAQTVSIPSFNLQVGQTKNPSEVASTLQVIVLLTVLTLAPAILIMTTSW